jgi:serine/threonine protein phosphatase 1
MKTFTIGDIHGHREELAALLNAIPLEPEDRLVFLGDYVDKGPDVKGTLELLSQLSYRPNTVFLRGNHDQMLIDAHRDPSKFGIWQCLAGENPLASYGEGETEDLLGLIPAHHWRFLEERCVNFFEDDHFIFVHGGIRPNRTPAKEEVERLQWTTLSMAEPHHSGKTVICGHTRNHAGKIADLGHTICIDTGISNDDFLSCLELPSLSYWQADSQGAISTEILRRGS